MRFNSHALSAVAIAAALILSAGCTSTGKPGQGGGPGGLKDVSFSWGPSGSVDFGEVEVPESGQQTPQGKAPSWWLVDYRAGYGTPPVSSTTSSQTQMPQMPSSPVASSSTSSERSLPDVYYDPNFNQ